MRMRRPYPRRGPRFPFLGISMPVAGIRSSEVSRPARDVGQGLEPFHVPRLTARFWRPLPPLPSFLVLCSFISLIRQAPVSFDRQ